MNRRRLAGVCLRLVIWALLGAPLTVFISMWGAATAGADPADLPGPNRVENPGFEQISVDRATYWTAIGDSWGSTAKLLPEAAQTGDYGIAIATTTSNKPWISQNVPVEEGATYSFSTSFKGMGVTGQSGFKIEFYTAGGTFVGESAAYFNTYQVRDGQWHTGTETRTAPPGAEFVKFYLRLYGTGAIYFDNASVQLLQPKPEVVIETDREFYYADADAINVTLHAQPGDGVLAGKSVRASIVDTASDTVVYQSASLPAAAATELAVDPEVLTTGVAYVLQADLLDAADSVLSTNGKPLYRWERPGNLPDGRIILADGQPFFPVVGYHAETADYPFLSEAGINTVQTKATDSWSRMKTQLDAAETNGLKALVYLYPGGTIKENEALIEDFVTRFKEHPAVLAWYLIDEPSARWIGADQLSAFYNRVRSIDDTHPVYLVEADDEDFTESSKGTDILATDPYPLHRNPISLVGEHTRAAAAADGQLPVWTVLQTFLTYAGQQLPQGMEPTKDEFRNMAYQAVLGGATGFGYYSLNDPGWTLRSTALWNGLVEFRPELELISALVTEGEKTAGDHGTNVEWGLWRYGSDDYAIAVNLTGEAQSLSVPTGFNGFFYEPMFAGPAERQAALGQALEAELAPEQAAVYKLEPFAAVLRDAAADFRGMQSLDAHSFWSEGVGETADGLEQAADELEDASPDRQDAMDAVASALGELQALRAWVVAEPGEVPGGSKAALLEAVEGTVGRVEPVIGSLVSISLSGGANVWLTGETGGLQAVVRNDWEEALADVGLRIDYPNEFAVPPDTDAIGSLGAGQQADVSFEAAVPGNAAAGSYPLRATVTFTYNGVAVAAVKTAFQSVEPALSSELLPSTLSANEGGTYPIEWKLTNRTGGSMTVQPVIDAEGSITVQLPSSVTLSAYGAATVQGTVYLPTHLANGVYRVAVAPAAGTVGYPEASIEVRMDRNLQTNPGFENGSGSSPVGWTFNNAVWDRTVSHSGLASARVDPTGAYNRIYPTAAASIPLVTGQRYAVGAWVKNSLASGPLQLRIRQVDASVETVKYEPNMTTPYGSDWTYVSSSFTAAPGAAKAMLYFGLMADSAGGSVWLDDVSIEKIVP